MLKQRCLAINTSALLKFPAGGTRPVQSEAMKAGDVKRAHAPRSNGSSRSHHVEIVLQRILTKRHHLLQQEFPRDLDSEEARGTEAQALDNESVK